MGSDEHGPNPGLFGKTVITGNLRYSQPGLCAVLEKSLTREAIFEALKSRRCYGSSGARIAIDFRINSINMGESSAIPAGQQRVLYISIQGEDILNTVTLVKNNEDYVVFHVDGASQNFTELFYDFDVGQQTDWYYCRVQQVDGRSAWSSPIWIDAG